MIDVTTLILQLQVPDFVVITAITLITIIMAVLLFCGVSMFVLRWVQTAHPHYLHHLANPVVLSSVVIIITGIAIVAILLPLLPLCPSSIQLLERIQKVDVELYRFLAQKNQWVVGIAVSQACRPTALCGLSCVITAPKFPHLDNKCCQC